PTPAAFAITPILREAFASVSVQRRARSEQAPTVAATRFGPPPMSAFEIWLLTVSSTKVVVANYSLFFERQRPARSMSQSSENTERGNRSSVSTAACDEATGDVDQPSVVAR